MKCSALACSGCPSQGTFLFDQQGQPVGRFRMPSELDRLSERLATLLQMSEA